jgi:hypothetical protein
VLVLTITIIWLRAGPLTQVEILIRNVDPIRVFTLGRDNPIMRTNIDILTVLQPLVVSIILVLSTVSSRVSSSISIIIRYFLMISVFLRKETYAHLHISFPSMPTPMH